MKISIRNRLSIVISLVFFGVFVFVFVSGFFALYIGLDKEMDNTLQVETNRMIPFFESKYIHLITNDQEERRVLRDKFLDDLDEYYGYKQDFIIFALESKDSKWIYSAGGLRNAQLFLPEGFLSLNEGSYNLQINNQNYRVLITHKKWGTLIMGSENRAFDKVFQEMKSLLLIWTPITLVLILLGGHYLARVALKPVAATAKAAEEISLTRLEKRLPEYSGNDEFGVLVLTLNRMIEHIEDGVNRIRQFTQDAAHELRTPITILRGHLELLYQKEEMPEAIRDSVQKAFDQSLRITKIVDDLLLLSRSDSNNFPVQKILFRLDVVLKEIFEDIQILVEKKQIQVELNKCEPLNFFADELLIRRLLLNISENALKFTDTGKIEFDLNKDDHSIHITIKDTGRGIPEEELPHIFDRFYRANNFDKQSNKGSGLGLAISKWIVAIHNGQIQIESNVQKGTTVSISFPLT